MAHSDGGKGSGRRVEDLNKVNEGFDRIFGLSKFEQRLKKEREGAMMNEMMMEDDPQERSDEDYEEQGDEEWLCDSCGGPMYRQPHWGYARCDDCGKRQELEYDI